MQPVQALLEVAAFPDAAISAISFNFWHRLMRHLKSGFSLPDEDLQEPQSEVGMLSHHTSLVTLPSCSLRQNVKHIMTILVGCQEVSVSNNIRFDRFIEKLGFHFVSKATNLNCSFMPAILQML